jgi:hypothetical protein
VLTTNPTNGNSNGQIVVSLNGGTGSKVYNKGGAYQSSGTFAGLAPGTYTITGRDANLCTTSTTASLINIALLVADANGNTSQSDIAKVEAAMIAKWYPNPTSGIANVIISTTVKGEARIEIADTKGARVRLVQTPVEIGENVLTADLSDLANGIYYIKVVLDKDNVFFGKIEKN